MAAKRSAAVKVFGILNIIFGAIGLIFACIGLIGGIQAFTAEPMGKPDTKNIILGVAVATQNALLKDAPGFAAVKTITALGSLLSAALLLISGVALVQRKNVGRTLAILWAVLAALVEILFTIYQFAVVIPVTQTALENYYKEAGQPAPASMANMASILSSVLFVLYVIGILGYGLWMILALSSARARADLGRAKRNEYDDDPRDDDVDDRPRQRRDEHDDFNDRP